MLAYRWAIIQYQNMTMYSFIIKKSTLFFNRSRPTDTRVRSSAGVNGSSLTYTNATPAQFEKSAPLENLLHNTTVKVEAVYLQKALAPLEKFNSQYTSSLQTVS